MGYNNTKNVSDKLKGIYICIIVALIIGLMSAFGLFNFFNGILYDKCVLLTTEKSRTESNVLLVEVTDDQMHDSDMFWMRGLELLESLGAKAIIFSFIPKNVSEAFYKKTLNYENVVFGREVLIGHDDHLILTLEPLPDINDAEKLTCGLLSIPAERHSLHRKQYTSRNIDGVEYPTLEMVAAQLISGGSLRLARNPFTINFNGKFNGLPTVNIDTLMSGSMIKELVSGRVVVIDAGITGQTSILQTPVSSYKDPVSILEFRGYALDTLLSANAIRPLGIIYVSALLPVIVAIGFIVFQIVPHRINFWILVGVSITCLPAAWFILSFFLIWIPVVEIIMAMSLGYFFVFRSKTLMEEEKAAEMLVDLSVRLESRHLPEDFYTSSEHWSQIITMVGQTLQLDKIIFLECLDDSHFVSEVEALNCSIKNIQERRRDYERPPYSVSVESRALVKIEQRHFFKDLEVHENEYIIPLIFSSQVLGFWVFSVAESSQKKISKFESTIKNFASQISELLYRRRILQLQKRSEGTGLKRYMSMEGRNSIYNELKQSLAFMEKNLVLHETIFNSTETAIILYDLFGRLMFVNQKMLKLLKLFDVLPFNITASDLGVKLSSLGIDKIKDVLQHVILEKKAVSMYVHPDVDRNNVLALRISPLICSDKESDIYSAGYFKVIGLMFELSDIANMKQLISLKEHLYKDLDYQIREKLEAVILSASMLEEDEKAPIALDERRDLLKILQRNAEAIEELFGNVGRHLSKDLTVSDVENYPVDPKGSLLNAINLLKEKAELRRVSFNISMPEFVSPATAAALLGEMIREVIAILVNDAVEDSIINITLEEKDQRLVYSFNNKGFGLPDETLQKYISSEIETMESNEYTRLHSIAGRVRDWGGEFRASGEVGVGLNFTLILRSGLLPVSF